LPREAQKTPRIIILRSILVFLAISLLGLWVSYVDIQQHREEQKFTALQVATAEVATLSQRLNAAISLVYTLETILSERQYQIDQTTLDRFAPHLLKHQQAVSSLQYAPGGVVSFISPLQGNELAIGHNLLEDPKRNKEAFDAVEKKILTLAGPFELIQGGVAVIARLPIFNSATKSFWGFSTVLIRISDLFTPSNFRDLSLSGYEWNIYRIHPDTRSPHIFYGSNNKILDDAVQIQMDVPNARWFINLKPAGGWLVGEHVHIATQICIYLILAIVIAYLIFFFQKQPLNLQKQVEARTAELNRAKKNLEDSELRLRQIADNEEMWIWEVDAAGLYTYCSSTCEKLFGFTVEEIIGKKHFYDLFHPEDQDELKTAAFAVFNKKGTFKEFRNRNIDRGGNTVWLSTSGVPMLDKEGKLLGYRGADVNITRQVEEEDLRHKMEIEAIRSSQLATLGELSAGVAHEINNPISGVINYAQIIANMVAETSKEKDLAQRIIKEGDRIASIVSKLLSFSRKENDQHELQEIGALIDVPLSLIGKKLQQDGIHINMHLDKNLKHIKCNVQQIEQVLLNLLTNAQHALNEKYKGRSGDKTIAIQAGPMAIDGKPFIALEIRDNGIGIPADMLPRIFTPFFTTKAIGVGTGLGMSISENIVKMHGGEIRVESEAGAYTRVIIHLPA